MSLPRYELVFNWVAFFCQSVRRLTNPLFTSVNSFNLLNKNPPAREDCSNFRFLSWFLHFYSKSLPSALCAAIIIAIIINLEDLVGFHLLSNPYRANCKCKVVSLSIGRSLYSECCRKVIRWQGCASQGNERKACLAPNRQKAGK